MTDPSEAQEPVEWTEIHSYRWQAQLGDFRAELVRLTHAAANKEGWYFILTAPKPPEPVAPRPLAWDEAMAKQQAEYALRCLNAKALTVHERSLEHLIEQVEEWANRLSATFHLRSFRMHGVCELQYVATLWKNQKGHHKLYEAMGVTPREAVGQLLEQVVRNPPLADHRTWDYPDADCTDWAHPAWWRGEKHTTRVLAQEVVSTLRGLPNGVRHWTVNDLPVPDAAEAWSEARGFLKDAAAALREQEAREKGEGA